eukprot:258159_1
MDVENENKTYYYSFGAQYRYTQNLQQHPLYVKSKYNTLKEELEAYFRGIQNPEKDSGVLFQTQLKKIESIDANLRPILRTIVNFPSVKNISLETTTSYRQHNTSIFQLLKNEDQMFETLISLLIDLLDDTNEIYEKNEVNHKDNHRDDGKDDDKTQDDSDDEFELDYYDLDEIKTRAYSVLADAFEVHMKIVDQTIRTCVEQYFHQNDIDISRYYSNIVQYVENESDEKSNAKMNLINDVLNVVEILKTHRNEKLNFKSDLIEPSIQRITTWIKTYVVEGENDHVQVVVDAFDEIFRIQKHVFYAQCIHENQEQQNKYNFAKIFSDIFKVDFRELTSWFKKRKVKSGTLLPSLKTIKTTMKQNADSVANKIVDNIEREALFMLIEVESKCCDDITALHDLEDSNGIIRLIPIIITLLEINLAKINQLHKMYLLGLNNIEDNISEEITKIQRQKDSNFQIPYTNCVFTHFFDALLDRYIASVTLPASAKDEFSTYFRKLEENDINYYFRNMQRFAEQTHNIIELYATAFQVDVTLEISLLRKQYIHHIIQKQMLKNDNNLYNQIETQLIDDSDIKSTTMDYEEDNDDINYSKYQIVSNILLQILTETVSITKIEFFDIFIKPKANKYPMLDKMTKSWINDDAMKSTETQCFGKEHLIHIISEIFNINMLKTCISSFESKSQLTSKMMKNIIISASYSDALWTNDVHESNQQLTSTIKTLCGSLSTHHSKINFEFFGNRNKVNKLQINFVDFAIEKIKEKLNLNETSYVESQPKVRTLPFITKAEQKLKMQSVKKMKARWYQGLNEVHQITPNQPLRDDHVLAAVLYTDMSHLCTKFRETYRTIRDETEQQKIDRHSNFVHFARLLYEAFVFYGSTDSEVKLLYHGMSRELLFKTLYCTFDLPTSTTTAQSIACNFGGGAGIVMKLESSESMQHIKTLDMDVFSCFEHEEEHLIFETRLHIKTYLY